MKLKSYDETLEICRIFFDDCYKHWLRDFENNPIMIAQIKPNESIEEQAKELALADIKNLQHDPFSPSGDKLNQEAIAYFLSSIQ